MNFIRQKFLLIIVFLFTCLNGYSQVFTGAEIAYECLGGSTYRVNLTVYEECTSNITGLTEQSILLTSESLARELPQVTLNKVSEENIKIYCDSELSNCEIGGTKRGLVKIVYSGIVSFPQTATDWKISYNGQFLSFDFTTINTSSSNALALYTYALINNKDGGCNSSPVFTTSPVLKLGVDESTTLDLSAIDDNELEYGIAASLNAEDKTMSYSSPYSATNPVTVDGTGFKLNASTGILDLKVTNKDEIGFVDQVVKEIKNGVIIGETRRTLQLNTFDFNNVAPVISGFNGEEEFSTSICSGTQLTAQDLLIPVSDSNGDNISIEIVGKPSNMNITSVFIEEGKFELRIAWITSDAFLGENKFTVIVKDDGCPISRTTTHEFVIDVLDIPELTLPNDSIIGCTDLVNIKGQVSSTTLPLKYEWTGFQIDEYGNYITPYGIDANEELVTNVPGKYRLDVIDDEGCSVFDSITLYPTLETGFDWERFCIGDTTFFADTSVSEGGSIVGWNWNYELNNVSLGTSTEEKPIFTFPQVGEYVVELEATDSYGCVQKERSEFHICDHYEPKIIVTDSCNLLPQVIFLDITSYDRGCGVDERYWEIRAKNVAARADSAMISFGTIPGEISSSYGHAFSDIDTGQFYIGLVVTGESGCIDTIQDTFNVHQRPTLESNMGYRNAFTAFYDPIYLNCEDPDTVVSPSITSLLENGTPPFNFVWKKDGFPFKSGSLTEVEQLNQVPATLSDTGHYVYTIVDANFCHDSVNVFIKYPIEAKAKYTIYCNPGDSINFVDYSDIKRGTIKEWLWDFGNGETSALQNPWYTYPDEGIYIAKLTVIDSTKCSDDYSFRVLGGSYDDEYGIINDPICKFSEFEVKGLQPNAGTSFDTIYWLYEDGSSLRYFGANLGFGINSTHTFNDIGDKGVGYRLIYNYDEYHHVDSSATCKVVRDDTVEVIQALLISTNFEQVCFGDSALLQVWRANEGTDLEDIRWNFYNVSEEFPFDSVEIVLQDTGYILPYKFENVQRYNYEVIVTDELGCETSSGRGDLNVVVPLGMPRIEYDTVCPNKPLDMTLYVNKNGAIGGMARDFEIWYNMELINSGPLNLSQSQGEDFIKFLDYAYNFQSNGLNDSIRIIINTLDQPSGCTRAVLDTPLVFYGIPYASFETDSEDKCAKDDIVHFEFEPDSSVLGEILSIEWHIEDSVYTTEDVDHVFSNGGYHTVTLSVETDNGCSLVLEERVIYVKDNPTPNFDIQSEWIEANIDLTFEDLTEFLGDRASIESVVWEFDDGTTSTDFMPVHLYEEVKIYNVKYIVTTTEGCVDTLIKEVDLNTYLNLPNVFTPDGDGLNDVIGLIQKSIRELYEFKIYNRWGELVFDAEGDLTATWDGTFRGEPQELGVYVVHVSGLGAYDQEFNFQQNITLLR